MTVALRLTTVVSLLAALGGCPADPPETSGAEAKAAAQREGPSEPRRQAKRRARRKLAADEAKAADWGSLQVRRLGEGEGPVVVLFHGFGAKGDDLVRLAARLDVPEGTRFVLPEAPVELPRRGRAWWPLDRKELLRARATGQPRDLAERRPEGLVEARRAVLATLEEAERRLEVPRAQMILGGFSQGAMVALDAALHLSEPPAAVAVMSGAPLAMSEWGPRLERLEGVPVLVTHGRRDRLLSFEAAERLAGRLEDAGADVTFMAFGGAHGIPGGVRERLVELIGQVGGE